MKSYYIINILSFKLHLEAFVDMISKDKDDKLVRICFLICDYFEELQYNCERFNYNNKPEFADQEIMTFYLYAIRYKGHTTIKHIHRFVNEYLKDWFSKTTSYQSFINRINRIKEAFSRLIELLITVYAPSD